MAIRWSLGVSAVALLGALPPGCGPSVDAPATQPASSTSSAGSSETGPATTTGSSEASDGSVSTGNADDTAGFIAPTDFGDGIIECDPYTQDCPPGQRCVPWSVDGSSSWNGARCSPIVDKPDQVGEPCVVEGSGTSGIDSCDLGQICWDVDPRTLEGYCLAMCTGDGSHPVCDDPDTYCQLSGDGFLSLCLNTCDPIAQSCPKTQGCYKIDDNFRCAPTASEPAMYADACEFINECEPGLFCANGDHVPGCTTGQCCTEFCDTGSPRGDAQCPDAAAGQVCVLLATSYTVPQNEAVGACLLLP